MIVTVPYPRMKDFFILCKPKVVGLMLVTAWVGMYLASSSSASISFQILFFGTVGIGCSAAAAAVLNHLIDRHIDAKMIRTFDRPMPSGRVSVLQAIGFSVLLAVIGLSSLMIFVNLRTACLTGLTMIGYALFYTVFLKRATPQNIVIGGAAGATPPLLGWVAVTNSIDPQSLLLVLIIFAWTPPHFWALAIHRLSDYQKANIPMLPVTHGVLYTKLSILLYTVLLFVVSLFPYIIGMSGQLYLYAALTLGILFLLQTWKLYQDTTHKKAIKTFNFSIYYLLLLFTSLLLDHHFFVSSPILELELTPIKILEQKK